MAKLRVLADAPSAAGRAQKRGKLFEALMSDVLRRLGYRVDRIPSTNYSGMEIDIEGTHLATGLPLYAECKCSDSEVDSPKFQAFYGKYMSRWMRENRAHGLFLVIPGINPHAKGFYRDNCDDNSQITLSLYEEDRILETIRDAGTIAADTTFSAAVPLDIGTAGERLVLYTQNGLFVAQFIIPPGSAIPSHFTLFSAEGKPIIDPASVEQITDLEAELKGFTFVPLESTARTHKEDSTTLPETIVEVKGSSTCFEFQFPASPEHFVGRKKFWERLTRLLRKFWMAGRPHGGCYWRRIPAGGKAHLSSRVRNVYVPPVTTA